MSHFHFQCSESLRCGKGQSKLCEGMVCDMFTTRCRNEFVGHPDGNAMVDEPLDRVFFFLGKCTFLG